MMQRYQQIKHALGSDVYLTLVCEARGLADRVFAELWQRIEAFEERFSRFRPDSELTAFNHAAGKKHKVSPELGKLLTVARRMAQTTGGLYDPFVLPALQRAGYKGSWPSPEVASPEIIYEDRDLATGGTVEVGADWARIPANTAIDFGGIGKGYLLDELAVHLAERDILNYWLSLGGDVLCAGYDVSDGLWVVGIQDALQDGKAIAQAQNDDGQKLAVATSGVTKRKGVANGAAWHHIIDPRTAAPAVTDILTATAVTDSAMEADVYAKCMVIAGSADVGKFMRRTGLKNTLLQLADGEQSVGLKKTGNIWLL